MMRGDSERVESVETEVKPLFGSVPSGLFRLFAGSARHFYADLLGHLAEDPFGQAGEIATRKRLFQSIGEFIDRRGRADVLQALNSEGVEPKPGQSYVAAYGRLIETGWLVEYRDRYRRVVDFDPAARLVLHTLLDIQKGRVRSYGGAVLNVLTLLQSIENDPQAMALNVREAALSARGFMNHLRTVAGTMRRIEAMILAQPTAAALVRRFVTDFIEALVVQDYRNLHARESPYRFRGKILELCETIIGDEQMIGKIAEGWVAGGIATDAVAAHDPIVADLREVLKVFGGIDDHVRDIETTTFRIERRMTNVVRFSDRMGTVSTDRILAAMEALRNAKLAESDDVDVRTRLQLETLPLASTQFYSPPRPRTQAPDRVYELQPPDPALLAYMAALDEFEERVTVTPARLRRYIEDVLGSGDEAKASSFPVNDVDGFLVFERLQEVGLGELSDRYEVLSGEDFVETDWVDCKEFTIRRREVSGG
jgi:hypothetical protein